MTIRFESYAELREAVDAIKARTPGSVILDHDVIAKWVQDEKAAGSEITAIFIAIAEMVGHEMAGLTAYLFQLTSMRSQTFQELQDVWLKVFNNFAEMAEFEALGFDQDDSEKATKQ